MHDLFFVALHMLYALNEVVYQRFHSSYSLENKVPRVSRSCLLCSTMATGDLHFWCLGRFRRRLELIRQEC